MKISSLLIFILPFLLFSCAEKNAKEQASNDTISVTDTNKLFEVVPEQEEPKPNIDTIQAFAEDSSRLRVIVFSYYDTIPEKPLRKFKVVNENDSVLFWSRDTMVEIHVDGTPEKRGYYVSFFSVYTVDLLSPLKISLKIIGYEDSDEVIYLPSFFIGNIFKNIEQNENIILLRETTFMDQTILEKNNLFTLFNEVKFEKIIELDSINNLSNMTGYTKTALLTDAFTYYQTNLDYFCDSIIENIKYDKFNESHPALIKFLHYSLQ